MVAEDVKNQTLHVVKYEEHLVATITIDAKGAPEYHAVKWLSEDGKSLFVHRLAVHPRWHRQKIAAGLMDFARSLAVENGCTSIRLDVYSGNPRAVKFYESCGYIRTGQVYFRNKKPPFLCYEKILTKEI
jgi:ribosomal protein S18 acetylase RimI-like enzyme